MNPIQALPLLGITEDNAANYSIRLNKVMTHYNPWLASREELYNHLFRYRWTDQETNKPHTIQGAKVFQFLQLDALSQLYVFMGAFEKGGLFDAEDGGQIYAWEGKEDTSLAPLARRLVVHYVRDPGYQGMDFRLNHRPFLDSFRRKMTVEYIRSAPFSLQPFPGYDKVILTHPELVAAVHDEQWKVALDNVQAVYLQTDTSNGWHYIGSAYSHNGQHNGLLSRWTDYATGNHTGGNKQLEAIPNACKHIERYFKYSILEVFDMKTDAGTIIQREHWWMEALDSVRKDDAASPHGYNSL